jgi:hypothetical protein
VRGIPCLFFPRGGELYSTLVCVCVVRCVWAGRKRAREIVPPNYYSSRRFALFQGEERRIRNQIRFSSATVQSLFIAHKQKKKRCGPRVVVRDLGIQFDVAQAIERTNLFFPCSLHYFLYNAYTPGKSVLIIPLPFFFGLFAESSRYIAS